MSVRHLEQTNRDLRLDGVRILSPAEQTDGSAQVGLPWSRRPAGTVPAKRRSLRPRGTFEGASLTNISNKRVPISVGTTGCDRNSLTTTYTLLLIT